MAELGLDANQLIEHEPEPGLGNGGLGRLAACYIDSMATLQIPSIAYGLRYEFGMFQQEIKEGWQVERTDKWVRLGNPWEIARPEIIYDINFGGHTERLTDSDGSWAVRWNPGWVVRGMAYDIPIIGYQNATVNLLRLWKAEAVESFNLELFNKGDFYAAVLDKVSSENLTKVLYPNDQSEQGRELRLQQQYLLVSCSLQDMIRIYLQRIPGLDTFDKKYAAQLNDTHPALAVAELMRLLVDVHHLPWERAWQIIRNTFAYTNHTLLPEALEKWEVKLFERVLPRILEIIYEINHRFLGEAREKGCSEQALKKLSLIEEEGSRKVRMANLAAAGSRSINGVSQLHTELLKKLVLKPFYELDPDKFCNVTNGVTPRRFLALANPRLSALITAAIGDNWIRSLDQLQKLEPFAEDAEFRKNWRQVKLENKGSFANFVLQKTGFELDPSTLFDVQAKRFHEYKRQHLNILHAITLYNRIRRGEDPGMTPRTIIFAGKAAPGYYLAKLVIKLINSVAEVINQDPQVNGRLKVLFVPNFNVKSGQLLYPAADLSEQISTAGKEASGTGNMKFALNGALTIGTLDGANIEMRDRVAAENFFVFGLSADEVVRKREAGYTPRDYYFANPELKEAIDQILSGHFSANDPGLFHPLLYSLLDYDQYMVLADFEAYAQCQSNVSKIFQNPETWTRMSILNVARMGFFSSDRAVMEYCQNIWKIQPVPIPGTNDRAVKVVIAPPSMKRSTRNPRESRPRNRSAASKEQI